MSNDPDCEITSRREELTEIAECFEDPEQSNLMCTMEAELDHDMEQAGRGSKRTTFVLRDDEFGTEPGSCIIKFAHETEITDYETSTSANRQEVAHAMKYPPSVTEHFAPIGDYSDDYGWITMARVEDDGTTMEQVREVQSEINASGWSCDDMSTENVGILDGEPVLLDYDEPCTTIEAR